MATRRDDRTRERSGAQASLRSVREGAADSRWNWASPLDDLAAPVVHALVLVLLVGAAALHGLLAGRYEITIAYLIPVAAAAWRLGPPAGLVWGAGAAAVWGGIELSLGVSTVTGSVGLHFLVFALVAAAFGALRHAREDVRVLTGTDVLTGVHNAAEFHERLELERSRAARYNRHFTLAYLDVDGFRVVNQQFGHTAGDQILRLVANTLWESTRSMDSVGRMGGDEFSVLFPETGREGAEAVLKKVQKSLEAAVEEWSIPLSFTIGGVVCMGAPESVDELVGQAEAVMYRAKEAGEALRTEVLDENFGIEAILQRS